MAGLVTMITVGMLYLLLFIEMPAGSKDVLNIGLGVMLGIVKEVYSYIFGSSEGSTTKTAIIEAQTKEITDAKIDPVVTDVPAD
jgi:hypothetical protein